MSTTPRFKNSRTPVPGINIDQKVISLENKPDQVLSFKTYQNHNLSPKDPEIMESGFSFTQDLLSNRTYGFLRKKEECLEEMSLDDKVPEENDKSAKMKSKSKDKKRKLKKGKTEKPSIQNVVKIENNSEKNIDEKSNKTDTKKKKSPKKKKKDNDDNK